MGNTKGIKPLVIFHADCTDGFAAAFSCWLKLGDAAEYLPMQYNKDTSPDIMAEKCRNREVYILDFSFERKVMEHIFQAAKCVVWCDHHKTAFEMWCAEFPYHFEKNGPDDEKYIVLDNNKSGALLAWEYFHPNTEVPLLIRHIDDRDRWVFALPGSKELHAALWSYRPWNFEQWKELNRQLQAWDDHGGGFLHYTFKEGRAILRAQEQNVAQMVKQARKCEIPYDTRPTPMPIAIGLALNAPIHQSEIGHELANQSGTYGLVWYVGADSRVKCSLRSNGDYDVSTIAKAFSGGGHRNASGMEVSVKELMSWLC